MSGAGSVRDPRSNFGSESIGRARSLFEPCAHFLERLSDAGYRLSPRLVAATMEMTNVRRD